MKISKSKMGIPYEYFDSPKAIEEAFLMQKKFRKISGLTTKKCSYIDLARKKR